MTSASLPSDGSGRGPGAGKKPRFGKPGSAANTPSALTKQSAAVKPTKRQRSRAGWVVAIVFAFLYALDAFQGLSNLIGLSQSFQAVGVTMPGAALASLVGLIVAPLVIYGLVLWGTRRLQAGAALLVFLVGFAVVAAITLDLQSLYRSIVPFIIPV